jgi:hypothetical protein
MVMRRVVPAELRGYMEPFTRMGRWDSIKFPGDEYEENPRFRLLVFSNGELKRRRWARVRLGGVILESYYRGRNFDM